MSQATKAELWTQFRYLVKIIDETYKYGVDNTPNFVSMEESLQESYVGDHVSATQQQVTNFRNSLSNLIRNAPGLLQQVLIELAKVGYDGRAASISDALDEIYQGMVDASETVRHRGYTFGSVSAGAGNNSDGTLLRVTKNKDNYDLEGGEFPAGITRVEITADAFTGGTEGAETAIIRGYGETKHDELSLGDCPSGSKTIYVVSSESSSQLISNGGFETITGSAPSISVSGWTLSDASDFDEETTTVFRGSKALKFVDGGGDSNVLQYITSASIDISRPVLAVVHYNRETGSGDGTLTLRLGTQTVSVTLSSQTGWNRLILGSGASTAGWYENFKEDYDGSGIRVQVSLSSRTTGYVLIDEVIVAQPVLFDGKYYLLLVGSTDALVGDYWTFTDSVSNDGRIQTWLARIYGKFLPHTSSGETYADL
ncbi:MAG: hypothetical protein DRI56_03235 [Chloroflexota bacterium]|nr:MAG: hypothetical protein DRI56_03235 [Chloroflexota bacterium]